MAQWETYLQENQERFEEQLCDLLRIASISTDGNHQQQLEQAAQWLSDQFQQLGLDVQLIDQGGSPIVFAQSDAVPDAPTVLVYGHYDVQPVEPLDQWDSPPFEPTRRKGNLYARGATDDKGQLLTHVKSAEAWLATVGKLPVQLKFVIEGEEEIGSPSLMQWLQQSPEPLACDVIVISDTSQFGPGQPAITYGLRGILYFELHLQGPKQDLHSGSFGGAVTNPANTLCRMLSALIDEEGRIQVPEFYDDVLPLTDAEREQFAMLPFDEKAFLQKIGVTGATGERGYTLLERRWARPSLDVNGLWSGYQGEGAKTILPATAGAKFSFRLVPNQDPEKIAESVKTYLQSLCPDGITMELTSLHGTPGIVVPLDSPYLRAAARAIERGFERSPVFIREGGSIPIVNLFHEKLQADPLLLGWGQDDDNAHSPNEKFSLSDFQRGIRTSAHLWEQLSKIAPDAGQQD